MQFLDDRMMFGHAAHAEREDVIDVLHCADAAAELDRDVDGREDLLDRREILRLAGKRPVEVDEVQELSALRLPFLCHLLWFVREDRLLLKVALQESHALAAADIDCWEYDHGILLLTFLTFNKILQDGEPDVAGFLRMELRGLDVAAGDSGRQRLTVLRRRRDDALVLRYGVIAVHEVDVGLV